MRAPRARSDSTQGQVFIAGQNIHNIQIFQRFPISQSIDQLITVQGDRLESYYQDIPGQWGKIWLTAGSVNNKIEYAIIQNGTIGVQVDSIGNENQSLEIKNSIINNMSGLGILAQGSHVVGENLLVSNCGQYGVALNIGGIYDFKHSTFANYYTAQSRQTPNVFFQLSL